MDAHEYPHYKIKFDFEWDSTQTNWEEILKMSSHAAANDDDDDVIVEIVEYEPPIQEDTQKICIGVSHNYIERRPYSYN